MPQARPPIRPIRPIRPIFPSPTPDTQHPPSIQRHPAPNIRRHVQIFPSVYRRLTFVKAPLGNDFQWQLSLPKLRQTQLPLEIVSKGRFDKSQPTIHRGEDLDVPTYIRRGVALN